MRCLLAVLGLTTVAACSRFATDEAVSDAGTDPVESDGAVSPDASPPIEAGRDGDSDGGTQHCTSFAASPFGDGWQSDVSGGALMFASFSGRTGLEARVAMGGQRAVVARTVIMPADGAFRVSIPLVVAGAENGKVDWTVDVVSVACTGPKLRLSLAADGQLYAQASPPGPAGGTRVFGAPPPGWSDLMLDVSNTTITVTFGDQTGTLVLDSSAPYATAVGCVLTIGAAATGSVAATTVRAERACLDGI